MLILVDERGISREVCKTTTLCPGLSGHFVSNKISQISRNERGTILGGVDSVSPKQTRFSPQQFQLSIKDTAMTASDREKTYK